MEQIHDLLEYENLKIYQNNDWFSFSLDSVLLAYYATVPIRTYRILDLCTGNAPIPLILSRRTKAHIDAVEIQKGCCDISTEKCRNQSLGNANNRYSAVCSRISKVM